MMSYMFSDYVYAFNYWNRMQAEFKNYRIKEEVKDKVDLNSVNKAKLAEAYWRIDQALNKIDSIPAPVKPRTKSEGKHQGSMKTQRSAVALTAEAKEVMVQHLNDLANRSTKDEPSN